MTSFDLCLRHGSLHGVAEVSRALCSLATVQGHSFAEYVGKDVVQTLLQVAPRVGMDGRVKSIPVMCVCVFSYRKLVSSKEPLERL